jgi:hypothetical protein
MAAEKGNLSAVLRAAGDLVMVNRVLKELLVSLIFYPPGREAPTGFSAGSRR